jgi:hypothetical protein
MEQDTQTTNDDRAQPGRKGLPTLAWIAIALVVILGCGAVVVMLGLGVLLIRPVATTVSSGEAVTSIVPRLRTATATATLRPAGTAAPTPSATSSPRTGAPTSTSATVAAPTATQTRVLTRQPTMTRQAPLIATPTPIVCNDLDQVDELTVAPGQRFKCTVHQDQITQELDAVPDLPCSNIDVTLDNGQIEVICQVFFQVRIAAAVQAKDCWVDVKVTEGPMGLVSEIEDMIQTELARAPKDEVCIEEIAIDDGQMTVSGYGR